MDETTAEKCSRGNRKKPWEKPSQTLLCKPATHMEWPRCELETPAVGGQHLTACATRMHFSIVHLPPPVINSFDNTFTVPSSCLSHHNSSILPLQTSFTRSLGHLLTIMNNLQKTKYNTYMAGFKLCIILHAKKHGNWAEFRVSAAHV